MPNTSATGGYLTDTSTQLTQTQLEDFLHDFLVGLSGIENTLVRPEWQVYPGVYPGKNYHVPEIPDVTVDWLAFGIRNRDGRFSPSQYMDKDDVFHMERIEWMELFCIFYGPNSQEIAALTRDNLFVTQNNEVLTANKMSFVRVDQIVDASMYINDRWYRRADLTITLGRLIKRTYSVLPFASVNGTVTAETEAATITNNFTNN